MNEVLVGFLIGVCATGWLTNALKFIDQGRRGYALANLTLCVGSLILLTALIFRG